MSSSGEPAAMSPDGGGEEEAKPQVGLVDVADADHMVVGDQNDLFDARLLEFLDTLDG